MTSIIVTTQCILQISMAQCDFKSYHMPTIVTHAAWTIFHMIFSEQLPFQSLCGKSKFRIWKRKTFLCSNSLRALNIQYYESFCCCVPKQYSAIHGNEAIGGDSFRFYRSGRQENKGLCALISFPDKFIAKLFIDSWKSNKRYFSNVVFRWLRIPKWLRNENYVVVVRPYSWLLMSGFRWKTRGLTFADAFVCLPRMNEWRTVDNLHQLVILTSHNRNHKLWIPVNREAERG